jgi:hypothetical protein
MLPVSINVTTVHAMRDAPRNSGVVTEEPGGSRHRDTGCSAGVSLSSRLALFAGALLGALPAAAVQVTLVEPATGEWARRDQSIILRIDDRPPLSEGRIAIFVGSNDMTGLCAQQRDGGLRCSPALLPLPEGEQALAVYLVRSPTDWQELARVPLKVLTGAGLEVAEFTPRLDLNQASQFDDGFSADAGAPARSNYDELAGQGGIATRWRRGDWELRSAWNLVGTTLQEQALRYGTRGDEAPNVDLADYLVELQRTGAQLSIGHVSYGAQPLLLSGLSHRGLLYQQKIGSRMDFGFTVQSGRMVSGYSDMLGFTGSDNYIGGASIGFELLGDRPGGLRLNVMYLDAETVSDLDFNTGQVPDAQENNGYGLQLAGSTPGNRFRGSVGFASSRYTNPEDAVLSQGLDLVPVREETNDGRNVDLAVDLLQNRQLGANTYATVTLALQHLRTDPLYRTVGAFVTGDQETNAGTLNALIGVFSFQAQYSDSEDNVDDIPTILKTETRTTTLSFGLPLRSLFAADDGGSPAWLPDNLTQSYARMHQEGVNRPPSFDPNTHIPDQVAQNITTGLNWSIARASLGYQFTLGDQDNRQPGRTRADFQDITHGVSVDLQVTPALRLGLGLNSTDADDRERALQRDTDGYTFDVDWQIGRGFGLRGNYTLTEADDSQQLTDNRSWTTLTELNYRFALPTMWTRKLPGQVYLRYASQGNDITDNVFGLSSYPRTWAFNGGFTISLF